MMTQSKPSPRVIDPLLEERLARLAPPPDRRPTSRTTPARATGRRAKPAAASKVLSLGLGVATTLGLTAMFSHQDQAAGASTLLVTTTDPDSADPTNTTDTTDNADNTDAEGDDAGAAASTGIADGTYVGAASSNRWGTVQVQAVYSGGVLVDVQILSYPDGERKSVSINESALPQLIEWSLTAQSADVDTVSGATYTSDSYRESLQSAIDAAAAAS